MKNKTAILKGLISAVSVFILGFFMMFLLWEIIRSPNGLPGLFYYRAATIGDAFCLPLLTGASVAFVQYSKKLHIREKRTSSAIAVISSILAAVIQASWLIRDDTVLNWSIPIQHHFNIAGWYHSLFFIGMFGVLAYQLSNMWFVIKHKQEEYTWQEKISFMLTISAMALFLFMFVSDDYSAYLPMAVLLSVTAISILCFITVFLVTTKGKNICLLLPEMISGVITAYSIALGICLPVHGDIILALGGGFCVCFLWRVEKHSFGKILYKDLWTIIFYSLTLYMSSGLTRFVEQIIVLAFIIIVTMVLEYLYTGDMVYRSASLVIICIYMIVNAHMLTAIPIEITSRLLFALSISLLFKKEITSYFSELITVEKMKNKNMIEEKEFVHTKSKVYLQIVIGIIAAIVLMCHWQMDIGKTRGSSIGTGILTIPSWFTILLTLLIFVLWILGSNKLRKYTSVKLSAVFISIVLYILSIIIVLVNIGELPNLLWFPIKIVMLCCSVCACVGAAILLAHGYYMNMVLLRGLSRKKLALTMAVIQLIATLVFDFMVTILILSQQTWKSIFLILVMETVIFIIIPVLNGRVLQYEIIDSHVVGNSPIGGIAQDGLMISLIIVFAACMPCLYICLFKTLDALTISGVLGLLGAAFAPIGFCLHNNVAHIQQQHEVLKDYPDEKKRWDTLHECLVRQSKQTVFAMLPYICIVVVTKVLTGISKNIKVKDSLKQLYNKYIDKENYEKDDMREIDNNEE